MSKISVSVGLVGIAVLLGFVYVHFFGKTDVKNYPSSGEGIVAFGDSLVEGVGSKNGTGFVGPLSSMLREPIKNYGRPGDTTAQGLERLPQVLSENPNPKVVLVLLGGNDYLRKVPIEQTFSNLRSIITDIQKTGAVVVLLGVRGGALGDKFESRFEALADEMKVGYVSDVLSGLYGRSEYMSDTVHPNDAGYGKIAMRVYPILVTLIK
jgi:acyl-CoA thioesterase I